MTTLNTIIEEEKKEFENLGRILVEEKQIEGYGLMRTYTGGATQEQIDFLTSAIQRAVEYERARIRESFDDWFKNGTEDVEEWADRNLPTNQGQISR